MAGLLSKRKADFLVPHRKDYYQLLLVHRCNSRHWLDMQRLDLQPNTLYFTTPAHVHLKEQRGQVRRVDLNAKPNDGELLGHHQRPVDGH